MCGGGFRVGFHGSPGGCSRDTEVRIGLRLGSPLPAPCAATHTRSGAHAGQLGDVAQRPPSHDPASAVFLLPRYASDAHRLPVVAAFNPSRAGTSRCRPRRHACHHHLHATIDALSCRGPR